MATFVTGAPPLVDGHGVDALGGDCCCCVPGAATATSAARLPEEAARARLSLTAWPLAKSPDAPSVALLPLSGATRPLRSIGVHLDVPAEPPAATELDA